CNLTPNEPSRAVFHSLWKELHGCSSRYHRGSAAGRPNWGRKKRPRGNVFEASSCETLPREGLPGVVLSARASEEEARPRHYRSTVSTEVRLCLRQGSAAARTSRGQSRETATKAPLQHLNIAYSRIVR